MTSTMQEWFESEQGAYVLDKERAWFERESADIFGFNAMQAGMCWTDLLQANRMPKRFCADLAEGSLRCHHEASPLAGQSLDLLVLPHVLEFSHYPHQVLREAERILRPEGHLLLAGFNPLSLWGLRGALSGKCGSFPWHGRFLHLRRLKDWLALLGFELQAGRMICYAPPFKQAKWLRRFACLEAAGDRWWALGGGVYLLHAVKRTPGMRLMTPKWREIWRPAAGVVRPVPKTTLHSESDD